MGGSLPLAHGGLGILSISKVNSALLENGYGGWICLAMADGGSYLFASIKWVMMNGVYQVKTMKCLIYGSLYFLLKMAFKGGFTLGFIVGCG